MKTTIFTLLTAILLFSCSTDEVAQNNNVDTNQNRPTSCENNYIIVGYDSSLSDLEIAEIRQSYFDLEPSGEGMIHLTGPIYNATPYIAPILGNGSFRHIEKWCHHYNQEDMVSIIVNDPNLTFISSEPPISSGPGGGYDDDDTEGFPL